MLAEQERQEQEDWRKELCEYGKQYGNITSWPEEQGPITDDDLDDVFCRW